MGGAMKHIPALDSLRGIAVLLVLLHHYRWLGVGWVGVQLFFVLSGFLITSILWETKDRELGLYLLRFYRRRTVRIFPVFYAVLLLFTAAYLLKGKPEAFGSLAPWLFTYTYNFARFFEPDMVWSYFGHFWSLAVEEQFYLVWPLLVFTMSRRAFLWFAVVLVGLGPVLRWGAGAWFLAQDYPDLRAAQSVYTLPTSHLDAFALGALISLGSIERIARPGRLFWGIAGVVVCLGTVQAWAIPSETRGLTDIGFPIYLTEGTQYIWGYTAVNLVGAAWILCAVRGVSVFPGWNNSVLRFYGKISYGLYIFHWPMLGALRGAFPHDPWSIEGALLFVPYLAAATFAAWLSYRYLELPFLRMKGE